MTDTEFSGIAALVIIGLIRIRNAEQSAPIVDWTCQAGASRSSRYAPPFMVYKRARRKRSAFPITDTELKLIAAAAITGLSSTPNAG